MTTREKSAIMRVLIDLIKADSIIDNTEIEYFNRKLDDYNISTQQKPELMRTASTMLLSEAVELLKTALSRDRRVEKFMSDIKGMTVADDFCVKNEALLVLALDYCLHDKKCEVISVCVPNIVLADDQVLYVSSKTNKSIEDQIRENYRQINTEFKHAGLNFVFLPNVIDHYREASEVFGSVCDFIAFGESNEKIEAMKEYILNLNTPRFCRDQLYGKMNMSSLFDTDPAILVSIGKDYVNGELYYNFLKVNFKEYGKVVDQLLTFVDNYLSYLSYDIVVIPKVEEEKGHFLYSGFYKQLFEVYMLDNSGKSSLKIDTLQQEILLPEIHKKLDGHIHPKEKAFYMLILLGMIENGGINFKKERFNEDTERKLDALQKQYEKLYEDIGGSGKDKIPSIKDPKGRSQMKTRINKYFKENRGTLHEFELFEVKFNSEKQIFYVQLDLDNISVVECGADGQPKKLADSNLYSSFKASFQNRK